MFLIFVERDHLIPPLFIRCVKCSIKYHHQHLSYPHKSVSFWCHDFIKLLILMRRLWSCMGSKFGMSLDIVYRFTLPYSSIDEINSRNAVIKGRLIFKTRHVVPSPVFDFYCRKTFYQGAIARDHEQSFHTWRHPNKKVGWQRILGNSQWQRVCFFVLATASGRK